MSEATHVVNRMRTTVDQRWHHLPNRVAAGMVGMLVAVRVEEEVGVDQEVEPLITLALVAISSPNCSCSSSSRSKITGVVGVPPVVPTMAEGIGVKRVEVVVAGIAGTQGRRLLQKTGQILPIFHQILRVSSSFNISTHSTN